MPAMMETMAWTGEKPWHGLGVEVGPDLSPAEMLKASGLDWTVSTQPLFYNGADGKPVEVKGDRILIRDSDQQQLDIVGSKWKPTQNETLVSFLSDFVSAGDMKMNTMGSLKGGKYVWALASIEREFKVGGKGKDVVGGYLLMALPHQLGKSIKILFTTVRVVCWNTYSAALGPTNRKGKNSELDGFFKMSHSYEFTKEVAETAKTALGLAVKQFDEFKDMSNLLAKKKMTEVEAHDFFCEVLELKQDEFKKNKDGSIRTPALLDKLDWAFTNGPGAQLVSADHTLFGALNAVTFICDHRYGDTPDTGLATAWFGDKARLKERTAELLLVRAR